MIFYILFILVVLIGGILFLPVNIHFKYLDKVSLRARWLFFNFDLLKVKAEKEKPSKKNKKAEKTPKSEDSEPKSKKTGLKQTISLVIDIFKGLKSPLKKFYKRIKIRELMLEISVGTDNAAETAIQYGIISAAAFGLIALIDEDFNLKTKQVSVYPDFLTEETKAYIEFKGKITFFSALCFILSIDSTKGTELLKQLKSNQ